MDIDNLMRSIQQGNDTYLFYVAHMIEPREGLLDEHIYKSASKFKVIKVKVTDIQNAYFEYLNYVNNSNNYHEETEESYYDCKTKYINRYIVPNGSGSYIKDFNPRTPSIIYGYRRQIIDLVTKKFKIVTDPSPIKVKYTNLLQYQDLVGNDVNEIFNSGALDWKYKKLSKVAVVDGIKYNYITSDWYILDIENFPRTEKPLINTKQISCYFTTLTDAFNYIDQLIA